MPTFKNILIDLDGREGVFGFPTMANSTPHTSVDVIRAWHSDRLETREGLHSVAQRRGPGIVGRPVLHCVGLSCTPWDI